MKQAESGLETGAIEVLMGNIIMVRNFKKQMINLVTYNGPGMTLAFLINEYGTIMIGLVGNAKNG